MLRVAGQFTGLARFQHEQHEGVQALPALGLFGASGTRTRLDALWERLP